MDDDTKAGPFHHSHCASRLSHAFIFGGVWGTLLSALLCVSVQFSSIICYPSTFQPLGKSLSNPIPYQRLLASRLPFRFHRHKSGLYALLIRILRGYLNFQFDAVDIHNRPLLAAGCWLTGDIVIGSQGWWLRSQGHLGSQVPGAGGYIYCQPARYVYAHSILQRRKNVIKCL